MITCKLCGEKNIIKLKGSHLPYIKIIPTGNCVNILHKEMEEIHIEPVNIFRCELK